MKKLMIAAAIAMVAICSEAVSVKWSVSESASGTKYLSEAADLTGWKTYIFTKSGWDDNFTGTAAILALVPETVDQYYYSGTGTFDSKERYDTAAQFVMAEKLAKNMNATAAAEGFYIIVSDGNQYYKSGLITDATVFADGDNPQDYKPAQILITTSDHPIGSVSAPLETFSVPEPTSGLLLLLGVAGLALKRKRA